MSWYGDRVLSAVFPVHFDDYHETFVTGHRGKVVERRCDIDGATAVLTSAIRGPLLGVAVGRPVEGALRTAEEKRYVQPDWATSYPITLTWNEVSIEVAVSHAPGAWFYALADGIAFARHAERVLILVPDEELRNVLLDQLERVVID